VDVLLRVPVDAGHGERCAALSAEGVARLEVGGVGPAGALDIPERVLVRRDDGAGAVAMRTVGADRDLTSSLWPVPRWRRPSANGLVCGARLRSKSRTGQVLNFRTKR